MYRQASLLLLSLVVGLVAGGCVGEELPTAATGRNLATQGAAVVNGASTVTLCNLPRYTAQTTVQLCGFTTPGSDGSAIASAWFSVDEGAAIAVVPGNGGFVDTSTFLAEGSHAIRLYAMSDAGNLTFEEKMVTVDVTPPVLQVLSPTSADVMVSTVVNVTSSVSDITPVHIQTQWGPSSTVDSGTGTVTHTVDLVNRGYNLLLVRAIDATGHTTEAVVTVYFCPTIDEACFASAHWAPAIVSTNQSTHTVPVGGSVSFHVVASDPQSSPLSYSWTANVGTLGVPASDSTTSEVVWTPPACVPAGTSPSITATATNVVGGSASISFFLAAAGVCPPPSSCGDGVTNGFEACDDGNTVTEISCPYGQAGCIACSADCTRVLMLTGPFCGDGVPNGAEACDDGNTTSESSCPYGQATCSTCNATCTAVLHLTGPICGDGVKNGGEVCDDGNTTSESSCPYGHSSCSTCNAACNAVLNLNGAFCGDGVRNGPETCDDGNTVTETTCPSGQATCSTCNATCTTEFHSLSVAVVGTGVGSVSSSPAGITCPSVKCTALVARGTSVTLTATPANNSTFLGWTGGGCSGTGGCTVAMAQAASITADFKAPPATATAIALAASETYSLALRQDGTVWASGSNSYGQLGDGTTTLRVSPVQVSGLTGVTAVSALRYHSLALREDGTVWAWGTNAAGQLGDGTTTQRLLPIQVPTLTNITAIAASALHSLALRSDGTVWGWGTNGLGQLGDGTTTQRLLPVQANGLTNVTAIAVGHGHSLALRSDGTVWAWGTNSNGQLGDGSVTRRLLPVQVPNLTGITMVAAGWRHSLALRSDGTLWAWGDNAVGQLGDTSITERHSPVRVAGISSVTAMAAGHIHSLAVRSDGTVWAWGGNTWGNLGDGTSADRRWPVRVTGLTGATSVSAGYTHSLALRQDGTVWAWGHNGWGNLGDGTTTLRVSPVRSLLPPEG